MVAKALATRNLGGVPFLILKGEFVVRQNQMPDGDTIAFAATAKFSAGPVETNVPVSTTGKPTTNIRLQSIDAPEKAQPLGAKCRDALLGHLGINVGMLGLTETDFTANGPTQQVPGWLATHGMDGNQRPLGYVFNVDPGFSHGQIVPAEDVLAVLKKSGNYFMASKGWAYPAFYENTDETHAVLFQAAARSARSAKRGVWAKDATTKGFVPTPSDLKLGGTLVYPKFYRRVEQWKSPKPDSKAFLKWIKAHPDGKKLVQGAKPTPIPLSALFEVKDKRRVVVPYDVTKLWFSE